jgi:hypothetical protein
LIRVHPRESVANILRTSDFKPRMDADAHGLQADFTALRGLTADAQVSVAPTVGLQLRT